MKPIESPICAATVAVVFCAAVALRGLCDTDAQAPPALPAPPAPHAPQKQAGAAAAAANRVEFRAERGRLHVSIARQTVATYAYEDQKTRRPFFEHLKTPGGMQVTRNRPPVAGKDPVDHADMHPGLWLAFGDLGGKDFWRNKGPGVEHERFVAEPAGGDGRGSFAVLNRYVADEKVLCRETARYTIVTRPSGYFILLDSTFEAGADGCSFGSQEEMGLGVRVATAISVKGGTGRIANSAGGVNEKGTWGKQADWCDYAGMIDGRRVGVAIMTDPSAERKPWFHSRDYGVLVANPFGPRAGGPERLALAAGRSLRLRFAVSVHESGDDAPLDLGGEYRKLAELFQ
jgi:hypothetical protein